MEIDLPKYESLLKANAELKALVEQLLARISTLEKQLGKSSINSSKPPSTDVFTKKVQNNREKSTLKTGGQTGHLGKTLAFATLAEVTKIEACKVLGACSCGLDMATNGSVLGYERRQVWDLPELKPYIVEYQVEKKTCSCGKTHTALCEVSHSIQYGAKVKALCCYLQNEQFIPIERSQSMLSDIFGFETLSASVVLESSQICYEALASWETKTIADLKQAAVLHVDETGMRVNGKREWGHVCSSDSLTLYQHHQKRGKEAHQARGILAEFSGVLVHDRYSSYSSYLCSHSLCNAHLMRELKSLIEDSQRWAIDMYSLVNEAYKGLHSAFSLQNAYQKILDVGFEDNPLPIVEKLEKKKGKPPKTPSINLLECFRDKKDQIVRFVFEEDVPFDNNQAERDIRMFKLKEKISNGFRTEIGAKTFCRIRSYISTCKKQKQNVWSALCYIFENQQTIKCSCE